MKNKKIIISTVIAILVVIAIIFFAKNVSTGKEDDVKNKGISEVEYIEKYLIESLNKINNIDLNNIMIEDGEVDWEILKMETEKVYIAIPTITLDLYSAGIENSKILNFNKDLDSLMNAINDEDKSNTAVLLAKLYEYLPEYMDKISNDSREVNILKAKSNLFNAYSLLDSDKWDEMTNYINLSIENFAIVIGNSEESKNSYMESKCYIELNELVNSINIEDKQTFLIKYKNLVEDLENL